MKKVVLSMAGVMAAAAFAPQASALPLFARQTGMACNACHFQHFPMLNSFGRSFKASGFTLMGAQGKVEGEDLSIPNTLNMAVLTTAGYAKTNRNNPAPGLGANQNGNGFFVPGTNGEFSLFIGGRVSDFAGALAEVGLLQTGGTGAGLASAKIPMLWSVGGGTRVGAVLFTTDGQGASYGFEELNTGANAVHTMLFVAGDTNGSIAGVLSAQQYIGTATAATGLAVVANNDMGFINLTKFHTVGPADLRSGAGGTGTSKAISAKLGSTYLRVAGTFDMAGWDTGVGIQSWSGKSTTGALALNSTKATAIDGQMQGSIAGMPVGFYASYARAPSDATNVNLFNTGAFTRSALNISTEWGVIPEKATLGAAIRRGKSGVNVGGINGTDNAWLINATYKLAQNMVVQLDYDSQSGDVWNGVTGNKQTVLSLSTIF